MYSHRVSKQIDLIDKTIKELRRLRKELIAQDNNKEPLL